MKNTENTTMETKFTYSPIREHDASIGSKYDSDTEFWYGKVFQQDKTGKVFEFNVSNHLESGVKYNWRTVGKCRAGFVTIFDREDQTPEQMSYYFAKGTQCVQVYKEFETPSTKGGIWLNVLTFKGGRFDSVDKSILESLTVGVIHEAFSKNVDYSLWKLTNAKSHASTPYKFNK
tara:strand:- start:2741 stop:3265 length:525 start_codon:yes stop_codon:yes gene_type:complete